MTRTNRIVVITLGLVAAGAVCGAVAGVVAFTIGVRLTHAPSAATDLRLLPLPASIGAALGAVILPIVSWVLLRRVPLGQAILATVLGTIVGGTLGLVVPLVGDRGVSSIAGGCVGFCLAALFLALRARAAT